MNPSPIRALMQALPLAGAALMLVACASSSLDAGRYGEPESAAGERYQAQPAAVKAPLRARARAGAEAQRFGDPGLQGMAEGEAVVAEGSFLQALQINPFDPVALNNLAVARAEQGQFHEAAAMLERASRLQPNNAEIAANLARLRGYVQSYAMAGVESAPPPAPQAGPLPPAPPALWGRSMVTAPVDDEATLRPPPGTGYYITEACRRQTAAGETAIDIDCKPLR